MAAITAKMVADLRTQTGCGMMDCKKALAESNGDFDGAVKFLREKGLAVAAKKADRIAAEGVVDILVSEDGKTAAMIEVNAETDFVAKNEKFLDFVKGLLKTIIATKPADVAELLTKNFDGTDMSVEAKLKDMIFTIGENMNIRRFEIVEGITSTYIHGGGMAGVIVKFDTTEEIAAKDGFAEFAKNICLQIAANAPKYINPEDVPQEEIDAELEIKLNALKEQKGKLPPEQALVGIKNGMAAKYCTQICLTKQDYVADGDLTVEKYLEGDASFAPKKPDMSDMPFEV